ncbi:N-acetylmuramoyl-L-alanine amidase-like domain-containing protein [Tellurirhabdus rosea]|uniref:N-acetylmuramoyl-L-alanine amidase-like domain-containing protein n=1 Tax=Tellurirhabdus rosea TaxID=2674997 RepID=UPI0022588EF5|nr:N-acetylmuramoyl-L-alanine amidase-like domain-containing protein [Tellurirhabdus rosea]
MIRSFTTLFVLLFTAFYVQAQNAPVSEFASLTLTTGRTPAETMLQVGKAFLGKPYVPHTLDGTETEQLIVNFEQFDCTTYLETTVALTLALQQTNGSTAAAKLEPAFRKMLTQLRYRAGVIDGYASRLHYFSEWLQDNEKKGLIRDVTRQIGGMQVSKPVNYMTACTWKYPRLSDPAIFRQIAQVQESISKQSFWFIPKARLREVEANIKDGDIIMLTAARPGLDMKHVGFAVWQNGRVHLLHASSDLGEVVITQQPLAEYVQWNRRLSGIRVARLKESGQPMMVRAEK